MLDGRKSLRIDLVCQWFILNGISKTFCFGFIRSFFLYVFVLFVLFLFFFCFCLYLLLVERWWRATGSVGCRSSGFGLMLSMRKLCIRNSLTHVLSSHMSTRFHKNTHLHFSLVYFTIFLTFRSSIFGANALSCTILLLRVFSSSSSFKYIYLLFSFHSLHLFLPDLLFFWRFFFSSACVAFSISWIDSMCF